MDPRNKGIANHQRQALDFMLDALGLQHVSRTVLVMRGDGAGFFSPETSHAKAMAAANFRKPTKELGEMAMKGSAFWSAAPAVLQGEVLPSIGGVPIMKSGRVIGAIGCGGAHQTEQMPAYKSHAWRASNGLAG